MHIYFIAICFVTIYINVNTEKNAKYAYDNTVKHEIDLGNVIVPLFVTTIILYFS